MATATAVKSKKTKKVKPAKQIVKTVEKTQESPWYVFCSTGCGFCKKAEPVIEELNNEGYDILVLDMAEPDNAKLNKELQTEYKTSCGTPWFINAETGKGICGFREKDVLEKWLAGEDIPAPPRPTGPPPKPPLMGATSAEETAWRKEYGSWLKDNKHMPANQKKTVDEILAMPRPKSEPPRPPMGPDTTEEAVDEWGTKYSKWSKENAHLPNLQPVDVVVKNFKSRIKQMANKANNPNAQVQLQPQPPSPKIGELEKRIAELENKLNSIGNQDDVVEGSLTEWEEDVEDKLDALLDHLGVRV